MVSSSSRLSCYDVESTLPLSIQQKLYDEHASIYLRKSCPYCTVQENVNNLDVTVHTNGLSGMNYSNDNDVMRNEEVELVEDFDWTLDELGHFEDFWCRNKIASHSSSGNLSHRLKQPEQQKVKFSPVLTKHSACNDIRMEKLTQDKSHEAYDIDEDLSCSLNFIKHKRANPPFEPGNLSSDEGKEWIQNFIHQSSHFDGNNVENKDLSSFEIVNPAIVQGLSCSSLSLEQSSVDEAENEALINNLDEDMHHYFKYDVENEDFSFTEILENRPQCLSRSSISSMSSSSDEVDKDELIRNLYKDMAHRFDDLQEFESSETSTEPVGCTPECSFCSSTSSVSTSSDKEENFMQNWSMDLCHQVDDLVLLGNSCVSEFKSSHSRLLESHCKDFSKGVSKVDYVGKRQDVDATNTSFTENNDTGLNFETPMSRFTELKDDEKLQKINVYKLNQLMAQLEDTKELYDREIISLKTKSASLMAKNESVCELSEQNAALAHYNEIIIRKCLSNQKILEEKVGELKEGNWCLKLRAEAAEAEICILERIISNVLSVIDLDSINEIEKGSWKELCRYGQNKDIHELSNIYCQQRRKISSLFDDNTTGSSLQNLDDRLMQNKRYNVHNPTVLPRYSLNAEVEDMTVTQPKSCFIDNNDKDIICLNDFGKCELSSSPLLSKSSSAESEGKEFMQNLGRNMSHLFDDCNMENKNIYSTEIMYHEASQDIFCYSKLSEHSSVDEKEQLVQNFDKYISEIIKEDVPFGLSCSIPTKHSSIDVSEKEIKLLDTLSKNMTHQLNGYLENENLCTSEIRKQIQPEKEPVFSSLFVRSPVIEKDEKDRELIQTWENLSQCPDSDLEMKNSRSDELLTSPIHGKRIPKNRSEDVSDSLSSESSSSDREKNLRNTISHSLDDKDFAHRYLDLFKFITNLSKSYKTKKSYMQQMKSQSSFLKSKNFLYVWQ